jgi:DNA-binding NarL/FixJ family response regulator
LVNVPANNSLRIWIAAPSPVVRAGLRSLLEDTPGFQIVQTSASLQEEDRPATAADVLILAAGINPPALPNELDCPVLVLSDSPPPGRLPAAVRGVLSIDAGAAEIRAACAAIAAGLWVNQFDPSRAQPEPTPGLFEKDALTPREIEVLQALAGGLTNRQIAARLVLSENTVKFHISSIFSKLGAVNRAEAVTLAVRGGILVL